MNMLVSEMFNQIEMEDIEQKIKSAAETVIGSENSSDKNRIFKEELPDAVQAFIKTAK